MMVKRLLRIPVVAVFSLDKRAPRATISGVTAWRAPRAARAAAAAGAGLRATTIATWLAARSTRPHGTARGVN